MVDSKVFRKANCGGQKSKKGSKGKKSGFGDRQKGKNKGKGAGSASAVAEDTSELQTNSESPNVLGLEGNKPGQTYQW